MESRRKIWNALRLALILNRYKSMELERNRAPIAVVIISLLGIMTSSAFVCFNHLSYNSVVSVTEGVMWTLQFMSFTRMVGNDGWGRLAVWPVKGTEILFACFIRSSRLLPLYLILPLAPVIDYGIIMHGSVLFYCLAILVIVSNSIWILTSTISIVIVIRQLRSFAIVKPTFKCMIVDSIVTVLSFLTFYSLSYPLLSHHFSGLFLANWIHLLNPLNQSRNSAIWNNDALATQMMINILYIGVLYFAISDFISAKQPEINTLQLFRSINQSSSRISPIKMFKSSNIIFMMFIKDITIHIRSRKIWIGYISNFIWISLYSYLELHIHLFRYHVINLINISVVLFVSKSGTLIKTLDRNYLTEYLYLPVSRLELAISRWLTSLVLLWFPWLLFLVVFRQVFRLDMADFYIIIIWGIWVVPSLLFILIFTQLQRAFESKLINNFKNIKDHTLTILLPYLIPQICLLSFTQTNLGFGMRPWIFTVGLHWLIISSILNIIFLVLYSLFAFMSSSPSYRY